ncbi:MAG TPA: hypothetical protein VF644_08315 [Pyrinomonadaceae bacterium]|jgi:hypothetical protein
MNKYRFLNYQEREYFCKFIKILMPFAQDLKHPMSKLAKEQISTTMWYWTADAVELSTGVVKRDAIKYDINFIPATEKAIIFAKQKIWSELRHEHVVPRIALTNYILENDLSIEEIHSFLTRFCRAVIVTKEEDAILKSFNLNKTMPSDWCWKTGSPYARYEFSNLLLEIQNLPTN